MKIQPLFLCCLLLWVALACKKTEVTEVAAAPKEGLIAYYPFDGNANDLSGNNNNGTPINNPVFTTDRFGTSNRAYLFNGTNQYVQVPNAASLQNLTNVTLTAWVRVDSWFAGRWGSVACKSSGQSRHFQFAVLKYWGDGKYYLHSDGILPGALVSEGIRLNSWFHIAMAVNGTNRSFYYNGKLIQKVENYPTIVSNVAPLYVGRDPYIDDEYHNGALDDARIYNRALTDAEVQQVYQAEKP